MFLEEFKRTGGVWIMKPVGRSQGKGIFLFSKLQQINEWRRDARWQREDPQEEAAEVYVSQRYIERPYLVGGKKFDLRIYVLVASYSPLVVYLYRSGFARFSQAAFNLRRDELGNAVIHLTNVAVQRTAPQHDASAGMKWPLHSLKTYLTTRHGADAANRTFGGIQELVVRSLLAVQPSIIADRHCFELYGYDILLDSALKPWLLEVNASPSLTPDTQEDYSLKYKLLEDLLQLVLQESPWVPSSPVYAPNGFDLIWNGGPLQEPVLPTCSLSALGSYNRREADPMLACGQRRGPRGRLRRVLAQAEVASSKASEVVQVE